MSTPSFGALEINVGTDTSPDWRTIDCDNPVGSRPTYPTTSNTVTVYVDTVTRELWGYANALLSGVNQLEFDDYNILTSTFTMTMVAGNPARTSLWYHPGNIQSVGDAIAYCHERNSSGTYLGDATVSPGTVQALDPASIILEDTFDRTNGTSLVQARSDGGRWKMTVDSGDIYRWQISGGKMVRTTDSFYVLGYGLLWATADLHAFEDITIVAGVYSPNPFGSQWVSWGNSDSQNDNGFSVSLKQYETYTQIYGPQSTIYNTSFTMHNWETSDTSIVHLLTINYNRASGYLKVDFEGEVIYNGYTGQTPPGTWFGLGADKTGNGFAFVKVTGSRGVGQLKLWDSTQWVRERCIDNESTYFADNFNRPDGSVGNGWTPARREFGSSTMTWVLSGNKVVCTANNAYSSTAYDAQLLRNFGSADFEMSLTIANLSTSPGFGYSMIAAYRVKDVNAPGVLMSYFLLYYTSTAITVVELQPNFGGGYSASATVTLAAGDLITIRCVGTTHTIKVNGVTQISFSRTMNSTDGLYHGIASFGATWNDTTTYDNFSIVNAYAGGHPLNMWNGTDWVQVACLIPWVNVEARVTGLAAQALIKNSISEARVTGTSVQALVTNSISEARVTGVSAQALISNSTSEARVTGVAVQALITGGG